MPSDRFDRFPRRRFLKSTAVGAGALALAGCAEEEIDEEDLDDGLDDDDDEEPDDEVDEDTPEPDEDAVEMIMVTSDSATASYASSQGIAAVVNEHGAGDVFLEARPSEGTDANVGSLDRGEAHIGMIQSWTAEQISRGEDPFDDLSFEAAQTFHLYDLPWVPATANEWESLTDIEPDSRVNPTAAGSGTAPPLEIAWEELADLEYERVSFGFGEMGGAMSEGRLDVGAVTFMNDAIEAGWLQEMKGTVDLRVLDIPENVEQEWREDDRIGEMVQELDLTPFEGYDWKPDTTPAITLSYNFVVPADFDYDAVYDLISTLHEHRDDLATYHAVLEFHEDEEWFTHNMYPQLPFHEAAADYYEEVGLWQDEWERV